MTSYIIKNNNGELYNGLGKNSLFSSNKPHKEFNNLCKAINAVSTIKAILHFTNKTDKLFIIGIKNLPNGKKKETIINEYSIEY